jgi:DNA replication and repair protein RecF
VSARRKPSPLSEPGLRPAARIRRLHLTNFRSYRSADLCFKEGPIVFLGDNGAGKTNLLEAISFLAPGRGLRRATLEDAASSDGDGSWAVAATVEGAEGEVQLGTGTEAPIGDETPARRSRIAQENVASSAQFAEHLRIVWLVPEMDGLFLGPAGERRRFLDRLVLAIDAGHSARVSAFERALRARNRLLEEGVSDARYLDAVEHEVAELAVAVAAARTECVDRLRVEIDAAHDPNSLFPAADLSLDGWMEKAVRDAPAIEVEDRYRAVLRDNRERDRAAGRTLEGPHRSDLLLTHRAKNIPAARASTGERKALLVGVVVSHARLVAAMHGLAPVMLLDDVAAFLDATRRDALFDLLARFGAQVFMTGVDESSFQALGKSAERFKVTPGKVLPMDGV